MSARFGASLKELRVGAPLYSEITLGNDLIAEA